MNLEQQKLIQIFFASLEMNPSALHGTGLDHDSLKGKKIKQDKTNAFYFGTHLIVQICYNLLLYRHEGFT